MKRKRLLGYLAIIFTLGIVLTGCSNKASGDTDKTIKIVTTGVSFPGSYKENNQLKGFDVEVAKAAAKKIGYKVQFTTTSFDGLFGQLQSGKVDAIASNVTVTPEREKQFYFSKPYGYFSSAVAVNKSADINDIKDLKGKTIAATVGSIQVQQMKDLGIDVKAKTYDDREGAMNAVINKQTDGYSNAKPILAAVIKQKNLPLKIVKGEFSPSTIAITFNKDSNGKELQKKFNKAIDELQADGTISKLSKEYFAGIDVSSK
ncbi:transporter substrate-binding domain-containing protein [Companilactobacillus sp.]|jgi:putative amino-acid transport system substrate-binding protein|uniref:transporter substrate-binding domain-containing protein n=1 Tax=Companilactobacillus sp. TaxID=2767905 RepID=UPI0025C04411|nr:transporter substrate-binding domain-containing protein [Companilactobacillus sp.]MCH4009525.1 transporter substrate-binding domain-containing protein [Companilactobacillus sp.]MCH4052799.1 transporter substrate-binding domain-containing protein [Companilactobacillus sp.]MCH4077467.1 transporter substrate-binding domain-containing protein [Companilactobacillus sp.]MCH4126043.1 transporter substrate-binding domain-containing protein [Companilactobacillus sp.]MCI1311751.1 transporter substrat